MLMIVDDIADFVVREASLSGSELAMCGEMKFVDPHANPRESQTLQPVVFKKSIRN